MLAFNHEIRSQANRVDIDVTGVTGNKEVMEMVSAGVSQGISQSAKSPAFRRTAKSLRDTRVTLGGAF
ncbi:hypothetical protein MPLB_1870030 [Mesorhizobium sp. ORS 3324]|nr:hypothetical protein MPLB_1870030 [Mesorhizobium sp. ORS 3324]